MESEKKTIIKNKQINQVDYHLLLKVLQVNIIRILIIAVLMGGLFGLLRYVTASPYYTAEVKFIFNTVSLAKNPSTGEYYVTANSSDVNGAANIAYSAPTLIREDRALGNIIDDLVSHDEQYAIYSRMYVKGMLNVMVDGQIVTVYITNVNKDMVLDVAQAVERTIPVTMDYYFGIENTLGAESIASVAKAITRVNENNIIHTGRNVTLFTMIGCFFGAVLVYLIAFLRTYFDNTIYSEEELKNRFAIPIIGQIPTWESHGAGKVSRTKGKKYGYKKSYEKYSDKGNVLSDRDYKERLLNPKTSFAITEAFKHLRTNMCYTTKGEECAVYGITSAYVSAGKSMILANMAVSFAQINKRVLLIDCDLRCPVQHRIFDLDNSINGMSELLAGVCPIENIYMRSAGYENLDIITSGRIPPNPAELLASRQMKNLIEYAKKHYDFVFIDLPPICEVADAGVISELLTGYAFVVRSGYSDSRMIEIACETMEGFGASFAGFILNDIDIKSGDYYKNRYYKGYVKYRYRGYKNNDYRQFDYDKYRRDYDSLYDTSRYDEYDDGDDYEDEPDEKKTVSEETAEPTADRS